MAHKTQREIKCSIKSYRKRIIPVCSKYQHSHILWVTKTPDITQPSESFLSSGVSFHIFSVSYFCSCLCLHTKLIFPTLATFERCFQPIIFMIDCFIVKKSDQEFVRLKKLNFLENIASKTLQDQTISTIFCYEVLESSIKILKIEWKTKSDNLFESVGLGTNRRDKYIVYYLSTDKQ